MKNEIGAFGLECSDEDGREADPKSIGSNDKDLAVKSKRKISRF